MIRLTLLFAIFTAGSLAAEKPNLIIILADDMGYSDPGCYGGEVSTPAIDRLARDGVRLSRFHNGGMCVVSRASLLTGKWWPQALPEFGRTPLLPEKLKQAGYRNALVGKWHLDGHPMDRGFDHFFGFLGGFADHFSGAPSYQLDRVPFETFPPGYYSSDAFTDRAIDFVRAPGDAPFFLYLSYQAPHNPLQAPRGDILKHRGRYLKGWQAIREARFEKQKKLGLIPTNAVLPSYPQNLPDWNSLSSAQRDLEDLRMAVYAAMVERMDRGIGQLLEALEKSGKLENTFILFLSDNGADSFSVVDQTMLAKDLLPGDRGSNWQPGTGWAYASNTPWRLHKISQHGGGITTGAIACGPLVRKKGVVKSAPLHVVDIMPTLLEMSGGNGDGESFLLLLRGEPWKRKGDLFFQYMDNRAIRSAEWTLVEADGAGWELFHTPDDPLETRDLAAEKPDIVKDLEARWNSWWGKPHQPEFTKGSPHYQPQGDRGTGTPYVPSAMPPRLSDRYPLPQP